MNKLQFINKLGELANDFAFLVQGYTCSHDGYDAETADGKPIVIADINMSIQDGVLATIDVDIGSVGSKRRLKVGRFPNTNDTEWRIEDR
jgi:hypothetical protein